MLNIAEWFRCAFGFRRMQLVPVPVRRVVLAAVALLALSNSAIAQVADATLNTMGLERVWRGQIQMPVEEGRVVSAHLWTNPADRRTFAELTLPPGVGGSAFGSNRTIRVSADRLDATGKPIGIEAAKKEAETRVARGLGRASGIPAIEVTVPLVYLAVITSDGLVQTYDAETGEKLWANSGASMRFPAAPASVSDVGVVVAQGPYLFLFDWKTGKELSRRELKRASTAGVALIDNTAFVSSLSGQLMAFNLGESPTLNNWTYRLYGRTTSAPATAHRPHKLVAFASEDGLVTVFSAGERIEPWFNFEARAPLAGPITFHGDGLYCSDVSGKVTKVGLDRTGHIQWRIMIGSGLSAPPIVSDKTVYLTNGVGELVAADNQTGLPLWTAATSNVRSVLTATKDTLYCRSLIGRLLAIDAETGKLLASTAPETTHTDLINHLNDRVYLISKTGQITCLRQRGNEHALPEFHETLPVPTETPKPPATETEAPPEAMEATTETDTSDPFSAADAFGTPAPAGEASSAAESDPFATPAAPASGASPF